MILIRTTLIAAALIAALPAAAQNNPQRFRLLGESGPRTQFVVLSTVPSGPSSARTTTIVAAHTFHWIPIRSNVFVVDLVSNCDAGTIELVSGQNYANGQTLGSAVPAMAAAPPAQGTPYQLAYAFACNGTTLPGGPVWINGLDTARSWALRSTQGSL